MKEIVKHYGVDHQRRKFAEENLELQEAIIEYQNARRQMDGMSSTYAEQYLKGYRYHLIEELADNLLLIGEFVDYFDIDTDELEDMTNYKYKRTKRRMKDDKPR